MTTEGHLLEWRGDLPYLVIRSNAVVGKVVVDGEIVRISSEFGDQPELLGPVQKASLYLENTIYILLNFSSTEHRDSFVLLGSTAPVPDASNVSGQDHEEAR